MNILRFIPFAFVIWIANMKMGSSDMIAFTEILIFFFWIGYNQFLQLYYERCLVEFAEKHDEDFDKARMKLAFGNRDMQELKELWWGYLDIAKRKLPDGAYQKLKRGMNYDDYSKLHKFFLFIDEAAPILIFFLIFISY